MLSSDNATNNTGERDPKWTTGQGIGFLVALPGWIIFLGGLIAARVVSEQETSWGAEPNLFDGNSLYLFVTGIVGLLCAIPGTIVFNKCKRPNNWDNV